MHVQVGIKEAAKCLGISPSTLKRLCDQNIVPSFRTPGGHRRFDRTLINIAQRRLLGQSISAGAQSSDRTWMSLMQRGSEAELRQHLAKLGESETLIENLDSILEDSITTLLNLSTDTFTGYRAQMACQAALSAITWQSTRFLTRHPSQSRALGISSGLPMDDIGSALVELAMRMSRLDALALRGCTQAEQLIGFAAKVQARHIWICHLSDDLNSELQHKIDFLRRMKPAECTLLVMASKRASIELQPGPDCRIHTRPSQFLTLQMCGISPIDGEETVFAPNT